MSNKKNEKKIAFIICSNNELYLNECLWYIGQLRIPQGYEMETLIIREAESMAQGYNAAMDSSDAKYKVYIHQDVFILNNNFIEDMLKTFETDGKLGMIGVVGGVNLPDNAVTWCAWNRGKTYRCDNVIGQLLDSNYEFEGNYSEVEAIDGMLMVTQYDLTWREDLELGWDFYDITQSLEFRRKGYKVGIPYQKTPWCIHDCGHSKLQGYDQARKKVLEEYRDFFDGSFFPRYNSEMAVLEEKMFQIIKGLLVAGDVEYAENVIASIKADYIRNNQLQYAKNIIEIVTEEKSAGVKTFIDGVNSWDKIRDKYILLKFAVYYIEHNLQNKKEDIKIVLEMVTNGDISRIALKKIVMHTAADASETQQKIDNLLIKQ